MKFLLLDITRLLLVFCIQVLKTYILFLAAKVSEFHEFSGWPDIFRGYKMGTLARNELTQLSIISKLYLVSMKENTDRSSRSEVFLRKVVLKIGSKFTGVQPC